MHSDSYYFDSSNSNSAVAAGVYHHFNSYESSTAAIDAFVIVIAAIASTVAKLNDPLRAIESNQAFEFHPHRTLEAQNMST